MCQEEFPCYDQFLCLAFAQLTSRESLKDIETCLSSHHEKLYHGVLSRWEEYFCLLDAKALVVR